MGKESQIDIWLDKNKFLSLLNFHKLKFQNFYKTVKIANEHKWRFYSRQSHKSSQLKCAFIIHVRTTIEIFLHLKRAEEICQRHIVCHISDNEWIFFATFVFLWFLITTNISRHPRHDERYKKINKKTYTTRALNSISQE